jgi:hypothetical protein
MTAKRLAFKQSRTGRLRAPVRMSCTPRSIRRTVDDPGDRQAGATQPSRRPFQRGNLGLGRREFRLERDGLRLGFRELRLESLDPGLGLA